MRFGTHQEARVASMEARAVWGAGFFWRRRSRLVGLEGVCVHADCECSDKVTIGLQSIAAPVRCEKE